MRPGVLGISVTAWQGLSARDKKIFRYCFDVLSLGQHVIYLNAAAKRWAVFAHWDWAPLHVAVLGCLAGHVNDIPPGYTIPMIGNAIDRPQLRQDIVNFCESQGLVYPDASMVTWQDVLDAQGAPRAAILMAAGIPAAWTPEDQGGEP